MRNRSRTGDQWLEELELDLDTDKNTRKLLRSLGNLLEDRPRTPSQHNQYWHAKTDMTETKDEYFVQVELPGVSKEDIKVTAEGEELVVHGEKKVEPVEEVANVDFLKERTFGKFNRRYILPDEVDPTTIKSSLKDGILKIHIPKSKEHKGINVAIE